MGRFLAWLNRGAHSPRRRRAERSAARARRPLRFELCEPRLALSAAAAWDLESISVFRLDGILRESADLAPIAWQGANVGGDAFSGLNVLQHRLRIGYVLDQDVAQFEGGLIAFTSAAAWIRNTAVLDNAFNGFDQWWDLGAGADAGYDAFMDPSAPGLDLGSESTVQPIPPPAPDSDPEGGAIDLTAVLFPAGYGAPPQIGLATMGRRGDAPATSEQPALRSASPIEGVRGRAVVYEVAGVDLADVGPGDQSDGTLLSQGRRMSRTEPWEVALRDEVIDDIADFTRRDVDEAQASHSTPAAPHGDAVDLDLTARPGVAATSEPGDADRAISTEPSSDKAAVQKGAATPAEHDATLDEWPEGNAAAPPEAAAAETAAPSRYRHKLGAAAAVLIGAAPLSRIVRRAAATQRLPHRRAPGQLNED